MLHIFSAAEEKVIWDTYMDVIFFLFRESIYLFQLFLYSHIKYKGCSICQVSAWMECNCNCFQFVRQNPKCNLSEYLYLRYDWLINKWITFYSVTIRWLWVKCELYHSLSNNAFEHTRIFCSLDTLMERFDAMLYLKESWRQ